MSHIDTAVGHFHHHTTHDDSILPPKDQKKIVLVGNPNVGKSVFFNHLSGLYADVSNYPGTTVDVAEGRMGKDYVVDTPGIYGVSSFNDEERVARDVILDADIVLNVVDAVHLERDLFLTLQLIDMGFPMVVALNFMDEMNKEGVSIEVSKLSELLGIPVIPTSAVHHLGLAEVEAALNSARPGHQDPRLHGKLHELLKMVGSQPEALMVYEGDEAVSGRHGVKPLNFRESSYVDRRLRANEIIRQVVRHVDRRTFREWLGKVSVHPLMGIPILLGVLLVLYQTIGVWVAQDLVGFTEVELGNRMYERLVKDVFAEFTAVSVKADIVHADADGKEVVVDSKSFFFPDGKRYRTGETLAMQDFVRGKNVVYTFEFGQPWAMVFAGEFGVLTMTVTYIVFLLLPLVIGFYGFLSVLEDCGYLPRLATLVDRMLTGIGLNGRAIIPILLGFGCVTMATITTRLLGTNREKTIAAAILNFVIPCSAQLAVITALLAAAGGTYILAYVLIMLSALVILGTILNSFLPGKSSALLIDLPPMRLPRLDNVTKKTYLKTYHFMKEATPWFMFGAAVVSIMQVTGLLVAWQDLFAPVTTGWLSLPREAATAFVMGMVRRDFGAAGFLTMGLTPPQILVGLVTLTLFVPCVASVMVLLKERGFKEGALIWLGTWVAAFTIGGLVAQIIGIFH